MPKEIRNNESPYQGQFLTVVDSCSVIPGEIFPSDPQEKLLGDPVSYEVAYGDKGSYKDLEERAEELLTALSAFSLRNQRIGFSQGSVSHHHNGPIYGRYRERVPFVRRGANRNVDRFHDEAKRFFWRATGFSALRGTGLMTNQQINTYGIATWEKFAARFGTPINDEDRINLDRPNFQKKLEKHLKTLKAVKSKNAGHDAA